jgi:hypothetical protein
MHGFEESLRRIILAPYITKATALIGVRRKSGSNMFRHQISTLAILLDYKIVDPVLLKAAVIHDLFEDVPSLPGVTREDIIAIDADGPAVYDLVMEVTIRVVDGVKEPKREYLRRIMLEGSPRARLLKLADRISNLTALGFVHDMDFVRRYLQETIEAVLPHAETVSPDMFRELTDLVENRRRLSPPDAPAPRDYREEVEDAVRSRDLGRLALLGQEALGAVWESEALRLVEREQFRAGALEAAAARPRTILFTGHRIDAPGREAPRFPADRETVARTAIREAVARAAAKTGVAVGIAGAASGGDILFHEVCAELGVPTRLFLALPPESYVAESVAPGGPDWVRRFHVIQARLPKAAVLSRTKTLPAWLRHRPGYSIWQRSNLWMLNEALAAGTGKVTLVALWNGRHGDGPGGTANMLRIARERGAETCVLDSGALFGLDPGP